MPLRHVPGAALVASALITRPLAAASGQRRPGRRPVTAVATAPSTAAATSAAATATVATEAAPTTSILCSGATQWAAWAPMRQQVSMLPHALLQRGMTLAVAGLGAGSATAGRHTQLGEAEALQRCATAMAEVAQIQQHAHMDDTVKARQRLTAQAEHFFRRLPPSLGVSMLTAGPEHLVWFAQEEFSKQNAGEQLVPDRLGVGWDHAIGMPLACSA